MITINKKMLSSLLNIRQILITLAYVIGIIFILGIFNISIFNFYIEKMYSSNIKLMERFKVDHLPDIKSKLLIKCSYIYCYRYIDVDQKVYDINFLYTTQGIDITFIPIKNINFYMTWFNEHLTSGFNLAIKLENGGYLVINTQERIGLLIEIMGYTYTVLSIILCCVIFWLRWLRVKYEFYDKRSYKMYVENTIKGNVTEMLHHEINAPLSILQVAHGTLLEFIKSRHVTLSEKEQKSLEGLEFSIKRINSIVDYLRQDKQFRYIDKNTVYRLTKRVIQDINILSVIKIDYDMDKGTRSLLKHYELTEDINTGRFLNVLNIMIVNAKEAGATMITYQARLIDNDMMALRIKDNGKGIRDRNGKLFKNSQNIIVQFGYTSKERKDYENYGVIKNILRRLFNIRVADTESSRGIGLFMVKDILEKAHGEFTLIDTTENGTTFEITFPVRPANPEAL